MSKIIEAEDILADARDWMVRFFQGRSREETERIKDMLQVAFPRVLQPRPTPRLNRPAARTKRGAK